MVLDYVQKELDQGHLASPLRLEDKPHVQVRAEYRSPPQCSSSVRNGKGPTIVRIYIVWLQSAPIIILGSGGSLGVSKQTAGCSFDWPLSR